jgi:hypothetical protein
MGSLGKIEPSRRWIFWTEDDALAETLGDALAEAMAAIAGGRTDLMSARVLRPVTGTAIAATAAVTATATPPSKRILDIFIFTPPSSSKLATLLLSCDFLISDNCESLLLLRTMPREHKRG